MSTIDMARAMARRVLARLTPKQRQYAALAAIIACGVGALWLVFALTGGSTRNTASQSASATGGVSLPTNIGVIVPGQQVNPVDQWVGTAGHKLDQYEHEREEQTRINRERKEFEERTMQRFGELEQRLGTGSVKPATPTTSPTSAGSQPSATGPSTSMTSPANAAPAPTSYPPSGALPTNLPPPPARPASTGAMPPGTPTPALFELPALVHVSVSDPGKDSPVHPTAEEAVHRGGTVDTVETFLPVSITRATLLGGLDAPTGGQAQANPHPVLIRLADNAVLPNRFRAEYRECFVIAAGYGDISSERAYLRTETLSCVREDGSTLEVRIQGSVYGEDGKVGLRGRLVTKQGQLLANALLAGVVSGIGQGLATSSSSTSTSALGTIATASGSEAYRAGLGSGVGRALDRLAQYYIKLAEQTFPVIEVDAGREVDVVITKGVRIDAPVVARASSANEPDSLTRISADRNGGEVSDEDH